MYYFNQLNDSITYNCFLIPIRDATKLESLINNKESKITKSGDIRTMILPDSTSIIKWNNNMLYYVSGSVRSSFLADSVNSARYGIKEIRYQNNYDAYNDSTVVAVDSTYAATTIEMYEDVDTTNAPPPPVPYKKTVKQKKVNKTKVATKKSSKKKKTAVKPKKAKVIEEVLNEQMTEEAYATDTTAVEAVDADGRYDDYQKERAEQDAKKKQLAFIWITAQADKILILTTNLSKAINLTKQV
ncbi:hypothetical protein [Pedobacter jamesrossensis]|uniref:hypothetical protein n=1 Tax=Pedobacter jamesrossensis TaxID=1908238 RepID=UPI00360604E3